MRTIKYRVYNKVWGMMIDKEIYNLGIDETGIHRVDWINTTTDGQEHKEIWENPDDFVVMQFIGLKDKEGIRDIYEGDIIKDTNTSDLYEVVYSDEHACFMGKDIGKFGGKWGLRGAFVILGNIYENPELLN